MEEFRKLKRYVDHGTMTHGQHQMQTNLIQKIVTSINTAMEKLQNENKKPVLITAPVIRRDISFMLKQHIDSLDVLSFTELPDDKKIEVVATINLDENETN